MTKEEARKKIKGTKVYVNGKSVEIQERLFELGFYWDSLNGRNNVQNVNYPFIYIHENGTLWPGDSMTKFSSHKYKEVQSVDLLSMVICEPKPVIEFKPFDKVLARNEGETWVIDFYAYTRKEKQYPFYCACAIYEQIVPYNEETAHLLGTDDPAPAKYVTW